MTDPAIGLTMLGLIVVAIMMGFPTAFTLMGLGVILGSMRSTCRANTGSTIAFSTSWFSARTAP